jgi:hypothetical protein
MFNRLVRVGGGTITFIGLVSLPKDASTWWERIRDAASMFRDNPISGVAIVFGVALLVWGYREDIKSYFRSPPPAPLPAPRWATDKELDSDLNSWLRQAGWSLQNSELKPEGKDKVSFAFNATDSQKRVVNIVKPIDGSVLLLIAGVEPKEEAEDVVKKMTTDQRASLTEAIALELARTGLAFTVSREELPVQISDEMFFGDDLTPSEFFGRVTGILRAIVLLQVIIAKHVREAQRESGVPTLMPVPQSNPGTASSLTEPS